MPPAGDRLVDPEEKGVDDLVARVTAQDHGAVSIPLRPVLREEDGLVFRQARVVAAHSRRHLVKGSVRPEARRLAQAVQPVPVADRGLLRVGAGKPEPFERYDPGKALGPQAGVDAGDEPSHAVPDDVERRLGFVEPEDFLEIGVIVRKPVSLARPCGEPEAAPVGRDDMPLARERVDQELERRRYIHPAVQQEEPGRTGIPPRANVVTQAADVVELRTTLFHSVYPGESGAMPWQIS